MNVLHLLASGETGGIEVLNKEIYLKSKNNNYFCFVFFGGVIADEMKDMGANVDVLGTRSALTMFKKMKKSIKENKIEAIVTHHASPLLWLVGAMLSLVCKIPIYIYRHAPIGRATGIHNEKKILIKEIIFGMSAIRAKKIIAISEYVADSITKLYPGLKNKVNVVYNGVDLSRFKIHKKEDDTFTVIYVGRLYKWKGVDILLKAAAKLRNYKFIIVGKGQEENNLLQLKTELQLNDDNVVFCGMQRDIPNWHNKADVFVHPAIWEEGFGITLVEAMASGLPCVAFKKGAIPEIIQDGKSGFIVEKDTPEELAKAIEMVYNTKNNEPEKWDNLQKNAVERSKDFSIEKMVRSLDDLFGKEII